MGAAYFYHLKDKPLDATLPVLLSKALEAGWRVELRGTDATMMERLDRVLWQGEGFLPHGLAGGAHDAHQPILLTTGSGSYDASCVMTVDGAEVTLDEVSAMERVCILFSDADTAAVEHARTQWRSLTEAGITAQYWAEEAGRWVKKAESSA